MTYGFRYTVGLVLLSNLALANEGEIPVKVDKVNLVERCDQAMRLVLKVDNDHLSFRDQLEQKNPGLDPAVYDYADKLYHYGGLLQRDVVYQAIADEYKTNRGLVGKDPTKLVSAFDNFRTMNREEQDKILNGIYDRILKRVAPVNRSDQQFSHDSKKANMSNTGAFAEFVNEWGPRLQSEPQEIKDAIRLMLMQADASLVAKTNSFLPSAWKGKVHEVKNKIGPKQMQAAAVVVAIVSLGLVGPVNNLQQAQFYAKQRQQLSSVRMDVLNFVNQTAKVKDTEQKEVLIQQFAFNTPLMSVEDAEVLWDAWPADSKRPDIKLYNAYHCLAIVRGDVQPQKVTAFMNKVMDYLKEAKLSDAERKELRSNLLGVQSSLMNRTRKEKAFE